MEMILVRAMESWGICVYYSIEVHSVIITINGSSNSWNHGIPLSREMAYNVLMEATLSGFDPLCQGWK